MIPSSSNYSNMNCSLDEALTDALRLRMLSQEDTFQYQVQELHRLYEIQTMLMKNSQMKWEATEQLVKCSSQGMLQRPLRSLSQPQLNNRDGRGTRENPVQVDDDDDDTESSLDEVNLSLSNGKSTNKRKRSGQDVCLENTSASFQEIIDLEEYIQSELAGKFIPGNMQDNKSNCFSYNDTNKYLSMMIRPESSVEQNSELDGKFGLGNLQDNKSSCFSGSDTNKGLSMMIRSESSVEQNSAGAIRGSDESPSVRATKSREGLFLDLNEPPVDESVFDPKGVDVMDSLSYGHSERVATDICKDLIPDGGTSWRISDNNCLNEVSGITQLDNFDTVMMDSDSTKNSTSSQLENSGSGSTFLRRSDESQVVDMGGKVIISNSSSGVGLAEDGGSSGQSGIYAGKSDLSHETSGFGSTFVRRSDESPVGANDAVMSDQNAVGLAEDRGSSPASHKTGQSGIYTGKSDLSHKNGSPNSESSENESSPSQDESKCGSSGEKREEGLPMDDSLVIKCAESLVSLVLASSKGECSSMAAEVGDKSNEMGDGNKKTDKPQYSSDSYEETVLKQKECSEEDYCVSSSHMDLVIPDNKDFGVKLKRGRRMKDFQKDILPTLASLSRQEISEDVRLMDGIIRSREYKRFQAAKAQSNNINWFTPVRSKRSKLNYVSRKFS